MIVYTFPVQAQQATFIPAQGNVFTYAGDTISIFNNIINFGNFGSAPGAVINFSGNQWENASSSSLPGKEFKSNTPGGLFLFSGTEKQFLASGYNMNSRTGPSFPNIFIENTKGIILEDLNDLYVRANLYFDKGFLFLNGWNVFVNDSIIGYSDKGFVVTGSGIGGGSLYRKSFNQNTTLVFPIGTNVNSYSPLAIKTSQPPAKVIAASVFDQVYEQAINGKTLDSNFVKKTWQLRAAQTHLPTMLWLQHQTNNEGIRFSILRDSSYISLYNVINSKWDVDTLDHSILHPGTLTTGVPGRNTYLNNRLFLNGIPDQTSDSISWFSIAVAGNNDLACPVADIHLWTAKRRSYRWVRLSWSTHYEMNVQTYEVQRRRDSSNKFQTVATLDAKNTGGFSNQSLHYYYADDNAYNSWTYYRLKITNAGGCVVYTGIKKVPVAIGIEVWPNPTPGETHIHVSGIKDDIIMQLFNALGQFTGSYVIKNNQPLDLKDLPDATYFLIFRDPKSSRLIKTVKLVVQRTK